MIFAGIQLKNKLNFLFLLGHFLKLNLLLQYYLENIHLVHVDASCIIYGIVTIMQRIATTIFYFVFN